MKKNDITPKTDVWHFFVKYLFIFKKVREI
jgi:hypothetical protein